MPSLLEHIEATRLYQRARFAMNKSLVRFLREKALAGKSAVRAAEVACGSGFGSHLLAYESNVTLSLAADINRDDYLQAAIPDFQASFVFMDLFRPSVADNAMDLVWNSSSIEELPWPTEAVRAMARITKPGGHVFVGVPFRYGLAGLLGVIPNRKLRGWLGRNYDKKSLQRLLESAGLVVEAQTTYLLNTFIGMLGKKPGEV